MIVYLDNYGEICLPEKKNSKGNFSDEDYIKTDDIHKLKKLPEYKRHQNKKSKIVDYSFIKNTPRKN